MLTFGASRIFRPRVKLIVHPLRKIQCSFHLSKLMASSTIQELENQLTNDMGFPQDISKRAAQICGEINDPEQRLIAAINFIETDNSEEVSPFQISSFGVASAHNVNDKRMKMTVCVRKDLAMSVGKIASQVAHACLQLATNVENNSSRKQLIQEWQENSNEKIVVLECSTLECMLSLQSKASELGVPFAPIADAGRTEVEPGTITCIAIGPNYEHIIDKITGHLKLYV